MLLNKETYKINKIKLLTLNVMKKITLLFLFTIGIMMVNGQTSQIYLHTQGTHAEIPVKSCSYNNRSFIVTFNVSTFIYDYQTVPFTEPGSVDN